MTVPDGVFEPSLAALGDHDRLYRLYSALERHLRSVVEVLAVAYGPLTLRDLTAAMKSAGLRWSGSSLTQRAVSAELDRFVRAGLCGRGPRSDEFRCSQQVVESITSAVALEGRFARLARAVDKTTEQRWRFHYGSLPFHELMRRLRVAVYTNNVTRQRVLVDELARQQPERTADLHPLARICGYPLRPRWLRSLDGDIREPAVAAIVGARADRLEPFRELREELGESELPPAADVFCRLQRGALDGIEERLDGVGVREAAALRFLLGDDAGAVTRFDRELNKRRREMGRRKLFGADLFGVWHLLGRLALETKVAAKRVQHDVIASFDQPLGRKEAAFEGLGAAAAVQLGQYDQAVQRVRYQVETEAQRVRPGDHDDGTVNPYLAYFALAACRVDPALSRPLVPALEHVGAAAERNGYSVVALVAAEARALISGDETHRSSARQMREASGLRSFVDPSRIEAGWQRALTALIELAAAPNDEPAQRLAWLVTIVDERRIWFEPRAQKRKKNGEWTGGRRVALRRLADRDPSLDYLTSQDVAMCGAMSVYRVGHYGEEEVTIDHQAMLVAAAGHPHLYLAGDPTRRVDVVRRSVEVEVLERADGYEVAFTTAIQSDNTRVVIESPTRIEVTPLTDEHRRIAGILGGRLHVPKSAGADLQRALASLATVVTVRSELSAASPHADQVEPDGRVRVRIRPFGDDFRVELRAKPLGNGGPVYLPGMGGRSVLATVADRPLQTMRDLEREREAAWDVVAACPPLATRDAERFGWRLEGPTECLELLLALDELGDQIVVEWPEGERLRPPRRLSSSSMRASVRTRGDWFDVSASLEIDEGRVLSLMALLELLEHQTGAFVELSPGEFVSISEALRRRVLALGRIGEAHGQGLRVGRAAVPAVDEMLTGIGRLRRSSRFREVNAQMTAAAGDSFPVPPTFRATLRPYQEDGFRWLCRLADLGLGACLADEMGLGKTVQALALLVRRAADGPALVVAPTSVCFNWVSEAGRFAPTLRVHRLGATARGALVDALGAFDVLVTSYGLLHSERELLAGVTWRTVVLDEVQAIKNPQSKRSKAAMALTADARLAMTGTPVENHLGELWTLMRFLNPGLLGSQRRFDRRFAVPIEGRRDASARSTLRSLIQPFLLRRTKTDVLPELPGRTDVTVTVELSDDERAFYEATRRRAVQAIDEAEAGEAGRRFRILAELTRLRRACCHPRLVSPQCGLDSSKLATFNQLVDELIDGGHKALVFSQFVTYLTLVREALEARDIQYEYLDGSTSPKQRAERVAAFQAGRADLFLISLRAGGTGLNLTAADYVIHLDPWWNPAVEDQASDRAHRIGQTRPVTVYRLVASGTIEEGIMALHQAKRELAEELLVGTDAPATIDVEALVELLQGVD